MTRRDYSDVAFVTKPSKNGKAHQNGPKGGGKSKVPIGGSKPQPKASAAKGKIQQAGSAKKAVAPQNAMAGTQPVYDDDEDDVDGKHDTEGMPPLEPLDKAERVMCYNCREYGHLSYNCTKPKKIKNPQLAKEKHVNVKGLKGNAAVILEELDEDEGSHDNGDHPMHGGTGAKKPAKEEESAEAKAEKAAAAIEKKRTHIRSAIRTQLQCLLLRKDLSCPTDRKIVLSSCASIAKRAGAEEVPDFNVTDEVLEAFEETFHHSYKARLGFGARLATALTSAADVLYNAFWGTSKDFTFNQIYDKSAMPRGAGAMDQLRRVENLEPYSVPAITSTVQCKWLLGKFGSHVMVPSIEEFLKRVVTAFLSMLFAAWCTGIFIAAQQKFWIFAFRLCLLKIDGTQLCHADATDYLYDAIHGVVLTLPDLVLTLGALALSVFETREGTGRSRWEIPVRWLAHSVLERVEFQYAILLHLAWNFAAMWAFSSSWMLKATHWQERKSAPWNEDLTLKSAMEHASVCLSTHNLKEHPVCDDFKVKEGEASCDNKFGTRCEWGIEGVTATVYRPCYHNEKISMNGRVGKKIPAHMCQNKLSAINSHWKDVTRELHSYFETHVRRVLKPVPLQEWVNGFPPAKREMFQGLIDDCAVVPENPKASSFIKKEIVVKAVDDLAFKDPRFVQGCPPELSLATGPSLRRLAKHVRNGLAPAKEKGHEPLQQQYCCDEVRTGKQIVYTCGLSNQEIGNAYHRALNTIQAMCPLGDKVVILEDDQSRFDLHMGTGAFHFLNDVYTMKLSKSAAKHLRRRPTISGRSNLNTKYEIHAMMQSGWPDTSCGDTVVNAAMKLHIHGIGKPWIAIICGDDSVTVTLQSEIEKLGGEKGLIGLYEAFGMEIEAKISDDPLVVEFCSSRFLWHGAGYYLVPKTGKMLSKLCWDMVERGPTQRKAWMRGIVATMDMFGQTDPLMCALANNFRSQLGDGLVVKEAFNEFKHVFRGKVDCPTDECVALYYSVHYDMSWSDICDCVTHLSTVKLGTLSNHPLLRMMALVDC